MKDMKATPVENEKIPLLYSWHANIIKLNNRKHIIFINDRSRLCVIIDGVRSSQLNVLKDKFRAALTEYLLSEGVQAQAIESYFQPGTEWLIAKTNSRSVRSSMTEFYLYAKHLEREYDNNHERMKSLNRLIFKPIDYYEPRNVFKEEIAKLQTVK
nr:hypothetical protein [Paenibacillus sp. MMS18-CY102]